MTLGWGWPDSGLTVTAKSTPASAELVPMSMLLFFPTVTSVRRPITAEGLTTNTLPLPLFVFIPACRPPMHAWLETTPHIPGSLAEGVCPSGVMQVWLGTVQSVLLWHAAPLVLLTH